MTITIPKKPFKRQRVFGSPTSLDHVPVGSWCEATVGEESVYRDGVPINETIGYVVAVQGAKIYVRVADEVSDPNLTGFHNGDVIELELDQVGRCQYSPEQQELMTEMKLWETAIQFTNQHQEEFERRYQDFSRAAMDRAHNESFRPKETDEERERGHEAHREYLLRWRAAVFVFAGIKSLRYPEPEKYIQ
jgi:hypothetical protein